MEGGSNMETPGSVKSIWSPDVLQRNQPHSSTPYWPPTSKELDDSAGSLKQDSGYCSATPRSADSGGFIMFDKCRLCNKSLHHSCALSTPEYKCSCKRPFMSGSSPYVECMEAIKEVKMSPTPKLSSQVRMSRPLELGFEDAMDTSLYQEEMEVDSFSSRDNHQCSLDLLELGEEKSIDFMEPHVLSASQSLGKEIPPSFLPLISSSDQVSVDPATLQNQEKQNLCLEDKSAQFFSTNWLSSNPSPKLENEVTPTKSKDITTFKKQTKASSFQYSVKKIATMSRVVRSFYPINGIESVDFLYQLGVKKSFPKIVSQIFEYLSEKDLDAVRVVSKAWNKVLNNDSAAWKRWREYSDTLRLMKENLSSPVKQGGSGGRNRPALTRLQNVSNQSSPPRQPYSPRQVPFSPPVSPNSNRFQSYRKAAKSLKKNERLLPCPKCRFASTDRGSPVAQCPRSGCRHRFCVWCNIEVVPDLEHHCPPLYTPRSLTRRNTIHSVGSKSSKRNLRRL